MSAPRVWTAEDLEPTGVTRVTDKDGEVWTKSTMHPGSWNWEGRTPNGFDAFCSTNWRGMVETEGPVTEVCERDGKLYLEDGEVASRIIRRRERAPLPWRCE